MFSHVDERDQPTMVDVSTKAVTHRRAVAEARVRFPPEVAEARRDSDHPLQKIEMHYIGG